MPLAIREKRFRKFREETIPLFSDSPMHSHLAEAVEWIFSEAPSNFSFNDILAAVGLEQDDNGAVQGLAVATAISSGRIPIVSAYLEYEAEGGRYRVVPAKDPESKEKYIVDPIDGSRVYDYAARSYLMFSQVSDHD